MMIGISDGRIFGARHYEKLRAFGFDAYDFNIADTGAAPYTLDHAAFSAYLAEEKRRADAAGVTIFQVHGPWRYPPRENTAADRAERAEKMRRALCAAAMLGARYLVVHPLMPYGVKDLLSGAAARTRACNLEFFAALLPTAREAGVAICLENMPFTDFSLASPAETAALVREIGDPLLAMCLDTGHANVCKAWQSPAGALRAHSDIVKVLHVHDNHGRHDEHLLPFFGTIDWADFSAALAEVKFAGALSLECAPSARLPAPLLEKAYAFYFQAAKSLATGDLNA